MVAGATEPVEAATDEVLAAAVAELVPPADPRDAVDAVAARYGSPAGSSTRGHPQ